MPVLAAPVERGFDVVAAIPSGVLMFKQELPLHFPDDALVRKVAEHLFDPFEYPMLSHTAGRLRTDFQARRGKIAYHVTCHTRAPLSLRVRRSRPESTIRPTRIPSRSPRPVVRRCPPTWLRDPAADRGEPAHVGR